MRPLHGFYLASIIIGFFFTECKATSVYPTTFLVSASLFCITYYLCNTLKMEEIEAAWDKNLSEKDAAAKNLTELQFKTFFSSFRMMACWHFLEIALGKLFFETLLDGAVTCGGEGKEWHYRTGAGHLFLMLHIIGTM